MGERRRQKEIDVRAASGDVSGVVAYLADGSEYVRRHAIQALGEINEQSAVDHLVSALGRGDDSTTAVVVDALRLHPRTTDSVLGSVLALEASADPQVRRSVAAITDRFPVDASLSVSARLARDNDAGVRNAAMKALISHDTSATTAVLVSLLEQGESATVTDKACGLFPPFYILAGAGAGSWVTGYKALEYPLDAAAARALADRDSPDVVPALISAVEAVPEKVHVSNMSSKADTWAQAAWALAYTSDPAGTKILLEMLDLERRYAKQVDWVKFALAASRDPTARATVEDLADHGSYMPPMACGRTLSVLGRSDEREVLEAEFNGEPTDFVIHDYGHVGRTLGNRTMVAVGDRLVFHQPGRLGRKEKFVVVPFDRIGALCFEPKRNGYFFIDTNHPDLRVYGTLQPRLTRPYAQWLARRLVELGLKPFGAV